VDKPSSLSVLPYAATHYKNTNQDIRYVSVCIMSLIDAVGLFVTVLGIIRFVQDQIPNSSPKAAVLRVKIGHQENADQVV
jgi:hypothetical protein